MIAALLIAAAFVVGASVTMLVVASQETPLALDE
jgi:hypothetical protein